jgi:hypothetical protein
MANRKKAQAEPKPQPTWDLVLTKTELLHLRDVLSVLLPPDGTHTVSQALALNEDRPIAEGKLWRKVATLCRAAKLPTDDEAPDFVVMPAGAPTLGIMRVFNNEEPEPEQAGPDGDPSALFNHPGDDDDGGAPEPPKPPKKTPRAKKVVAKGKAK